MFRFIELHGNQTQFLLPIQWIVHLICIGVFFMILNRGLPTVSIKKILALVFIPLAGASLGASGFYHVVVEHKFTLSGAGQGYYGALMVQFFLFWVLTRLIVLPAQRATAFDLLVVATPFLYFFLRLGCFASGCCYGTLCTHPWAVVFKDPRSLTPLLGLPLHPTQLYAAAHGLVAGIIMVVLFRRRKNLQLQGQLLWPFLLMMGAGRLVTDSFRADGGGTRWWGLNANQWISLMTMVAGGIYTMKLFLRSVNFRSRIALITSRSLMVLVFLSVAILTTSCGPQLPRPPGRDVVVRTQTLVPGVFAHQMVNYNNTRNMTPRRNLLFAMVNEGPAYTLQVQDFLQQMYGRQSTPHMEDVVWWLAAPLLPQLYQTVVQIQYNTFNKQNLFSSIAYLESQHRPYDVVLLVHGLPNHLIASRGNPVISWRDVGALSRGGRLQFLNAVYMQACFGDTLNQDWINVGARSVIAYHGFTTNFLFYGLFLEDLIQTRGDIVRAFARTRATFASRIARSPIYQQVVPLLFHEPIQQYLRHVDMPALYLGR